MSEDPAVNGTVFFTGPPPAASDNTRPAVGWLVRNAAAEAGFTLSQLDYPGSAGNEVSRSLFSSICAADIVVVDLSFPSPNGMFEVGLATGLGKPVLLLGTSESQLPLDLVARQLVRLDVGVDELRSTLVDALNRLVTAPDPVSASLLNIDVTTHFASGRPPETEQHIVVNIYNGPVYQAPITVSDSATFSGLNTITTTTLVRQGDRQELVGALRALGLSDSVLDEMSDALERDAVDGAHQAEPGPHFQRWWTRTSIGAGKVAGKVTMGASGGLVARLIADYFGIP